MDANEFDAVIAGILAEHAARPGAMLPVLHAVQDRFGFVPAGAVDPIAKALNVSRAEVHGVVTYYHHFRQSAPGKVTVQVCRAEACQAVGGLALAAHAEAHLGCTFHATRADGAVSLEPVYCLGQCATGPAIMIGDKLHARVSPAVFDRLVARALA